jgi:hypothetical protein
VQDGAANTARLPHPALTPPPTGDPAQLPAYEAIDRLGSLTEDWDSYEAPAISPAAREWAKVCLTQIQRHLGPSYGNPLVGPTPEAVVALIWRAKGQEVDVPCSPPKARYVVLTDNLVTEQGEVLMTSGPSPRKC